MPRRVRWRTRRLDVADGDRIDAGEGLVEQHEGGPAGQRARDLAAPPLAAGERDRRRLPQMRDVELLEQRVEVLLAPPAVRLDDLQHGADVVLHRQAAEDRRLLRQVADAEAGALVHRQMR